MASSHDEDEDLQINEYGEEFGEEYGEEYVEEEMPSPVKSVEPTVVETSQPEKVPLHFKETSSGILSTVVSPFESSSSLKSTYRPISWPSIISKSDVYLQSSGHLVDGPLYPEVPSPMSLIEEKTPKQRASKRTKRRPQTVRSHSRSPRSQIIMVPEVAIKFSKCEKIPYLRDLIDDLIEQMSTFSPQFGQELKVSIDRNKVFSDSIFRETTEIHLPEGDYAGRYSINVEDTFDGAYIETSACLKDGACTMGTQMFTKITTQFLVVEEKKNEYQYDSINTVEKALHVFIDNDNYIAYREVRNNDRKETYRGCISVACQSDFLLDGNLFALMKHLILIKYSGSFQCYSITISGKVCRCVFNVDEKKTIMINGKPTEVIALHKSVYKYGTRQKFEISQSLYSPSGLLIYHTWRNSPYILHMDPLIFKSPEKLHPCMELNWKSDCILYSMFQFEKEHSQCVIQQYIDKYPEIVELLSDYIISLFHKKPSSVLKFTCDFFENF